MFASAQSQNVRYNSIYIYHLRSAPLNLCITFCIPTIFIFTDQGGMCTVYLTNEEKMINITCDHLEPVPPEKGDKVGVNRGAECALL